MDISNLARTYGSKKLQKITLSGVGDAYSKHSETTESKGVKAHFRMDESGILLFEKVLSCVNIVPTTEIKKKM